MRFNMLIGGIAAIAFAGAASADVVLQDGVFTSANWPAAQIVGVGTSPSTQLLSGGNPNEALEITDNVPAGFPSVIHAFHQYGATTATIYTPSTQGAITSVACSVDFLPVSGPVGGQGIAFALKQSLVIYYASAVPVFNTSVWQNHAATLTAADFVRADGAAGSPDFSGSGAAIRFGLVTYNSTGSDGTAFSTVADYDNFSVHIVPGPGVLAVAGLGGLGLRRRRS